MGPHAAWRHLKVDRPGGTSAAPPGVPFGYLARLQRAFAAGRAPDPSPPALVVTPGHGQRHVGHVLGKLGVASRTESVARGPAY